MRYLFALFLFAFHLPAQAENQCTRGLEHMTEVAQLKQVITCLQRHIIRLEAPQPRAAVLTSNAVHINSKQPRVTHTQPPKKPQRFYTVQVVSSADRDAARRIQLHLSRAGYPAYVQRTGNQHSTWYKVRIGRFSDMGKAEAMKHRLRKSTAYKDSFIKSLIVRG